MAAELDCNGKSIREINTAIKRHIANGESEVLVHNPGARHNLGVALLEPSIVTFDGSVGYFCGGLMDGATVEINGSTGWGLAESMLSGTVVVNGSAGNGAAATIRGGTVVIHKHAAARAGVAMKGGLLLIGGNCGYMAGFMGQRGTIVVCGDVGEAFADSMYETVCYVGGEIEDLGNDAVIEELAPADLAFLESTFTEHLPERLEELKNRLTGFRKIVSGRRLWNFDKTDWDVWQQIV
jgi:glutamate synthase domain-containing protein 3